jgi:hypothetical protein
MNGKASDGSFARTTRKTAEDAGRRQGREGLGQDVKQTLVSCCTIQVNLPGADCIFAESHASVREAERKTYCC